ncbi:ribbon-helix-helix protein, CopG family [Aquihabitans sp. McL0605]|uniref:ribbon-helix-helix protein, CopG family n=1 Tax=Aquihabitans sp. McL0605 TaxID=3415671 RepID=UPI003CECB431
MPDRSTTPHGRTITGVELTDEVLDRYVAEAEAGFDLTTLRPVRGRPLMGTAPAKAFPVRLDPDLRRSLDEQAVRESRPAAEIVREALRRYLSAS